MLRPLVIKKDTDLKSLASAVLDARFKGSQVAALAQLEAVNPHVDPNKISAGTVVLVPDTPGFKAAAASSIQSQPFGDFSTMVAARWACRRVNEDGNAARAAERAGVAAAVKSAAFKRLTAKIPTLSSRPRRR